LSQDVVPLDRVPQGRVGSIVSLQGGPWANARLAALGFTPGALVRVVRNSMRGPIIASVLETSIALGRGQARCILVRFGGD